MEVGSPRPGRQGGVRGSVTFLHYHLFTSLAQLKAGAEHWAEASLIAPLLRGGGGEPGGAAAGAEEPHPRVQQIV